MKPGLVFTNVLKLVITIIVGQTLFFKFSGAEESIYIFTILGIEPWGRIVLAIVELISLIILWIPRTSLYALLLLLGMMLGAIASHVLLLGIEIMNDKGELFILAIMTTCATLILLYRDRQHLKVRIKGFLDGRSIGSTATKR